MTEFYIICNILKHRLFIYPHITNSEIKSIMSHPATWKQICLFSQARTMNQFLYILGKLPPFLCVFIIICIGKLKKLI